jgi:predicted dehydrogenase
VVSLAVLRKGKHLYCEKPLCRTIAETRVVTEAARTAKVATQLGNYGHSSEEIRMLCEWIWDGAIGDVREVHAWTNTGARRWTNLMDRPTETPPVPAGFDWERWLDPVPVRSYHPDYAPVRWRSWWQFGSGTIGDFACHHLDPAFWALKLNQIDKFQVEASSQGTTKEMCPAASLIYFNVPARAGMPPVRISWYEGGIMPPRPAELEAGRSMGDNGVMYIGTKGTIIGGGWGRSPRIIPESKMQAYTRPPKILTRVSGHHRDWLNACKGQGKASNHFDYSGPLTEFVLMGNVALRAGKPLDFDWKKMQVTNLPEANQYIQPGLREGRML